MQIFVNFSRTIPKGEHVCDSRNKKGERGIWQRRFWEHLIRDDTDLQRHVDYTHYNPVKHGCARSPYEWKESSVHWYLEHHGREWLHNLWADCPIRDYGRGWDDV